MGVPLQNNLRKYQILSWIHALEQGWKPGRRISVNQPPTLANIAAHMLEKQVFPPIVQEKYTMESNRLQPGSGTEALQALKNHLNRLSQSYRSAGLLSYLTPTDIKRDTYGSYLKDWFENADEHTFKEKGGYIYIKKAEDTHLDLQKKWATDRRFVRILHLGEWGRNRIGISDTGDEDPLTPQASYKTHFAAKRGIEPWLSLNPNTDTVNVPIPEFQSWNLKSLEVPRIEVLHRDPPKAIVRDLDTDEVDHLKITRKESEALRSLK